MNSAAVLPARYRPEEGAQAHPVHLIPLPVHAADGAVGAICGALLSQRKLETVEPGEGTPCSMCLLQHAATTQDPTMTQDPTIELPTQATVLRRERVGPAADLDETAYRALRWPVLLLGDQVMLPLGNCATAQIMPIDLTEAITSILSARGSPAPVVLHPDAPGCGVVVTGEPYGVPLPWPETVQVIAGMLALPPSRTPNGPVQWYYQAPTHPLNNCREIDVFAAVRQAVKAAQRT